MNKEQDFRVNANGFVVLDAHDGYRQDNRLWFGKCSECGEMVTNSALDGIWQHELITNAEYHADGRLFTKTSRQIDYCPKTK
jgi:hypothetical protein